MGSQEGQQKEGRAKEVLKIRVAENVLYLAQNINLQVQEAKWTLKRRNPSKNSCYNTYIIDDQLNTKDKPQKQWKGNNGLLRGDIYVNAIRFLMRKKQKGSDTFSSTGGKKTVNAESHIQQK